MLYLFIPLVMSIAANVVLSIIHYREKRELHTRLMSRDLNEFRYNTEIAPQIEKEERKAREEALKKRKKMPPSDVKKHKIAEGF